MRWFSGAVKTAGRPLLIAPETDIIALWAGWNSELRTQNFRHDVSAAPAEDGNRIFLSVPSVI